MIVLLAELHKLQRHILDHYQPSQLCCKHACDVFPRRFQPHKLAFIVAFTIIIFSNFLLPLSPHKKSIQKQPQTDARANPKCIFMTYRNIKIKYHEHAVMPLSRLWVGHKTIDRNIIFCQPNWNENFSGFFFLFFKNKNKIGANKIVRKSPA